MPVFEKNDTNFGVNLIIPDESQAIPLQLRKDCFGAGTWGLPGGKNRNGETIEETAVREGYEELGIIISKSDVEVVNIGQTINFRNMLQIGAKIHSYNGKIKNRIPNLCEGIVYFNEEYLPGNLFLGTEGNIKKFFANQRYALDANIIPTAIRNDEETAIEINLIIPNDTNKVLLTRSISINGDGNWNLFKGRVRASETIEQAASRIAEEQLGVIVPEEEMIFNNFSMRVENGQNIMQIGVIVCHNINEFILPKKDTESQYIAMDTFPARMLKLTNSNYKNYRRNRFYSK